MDEFTRSSLLRTEAAQTDTTQTIGHSLYSLTRARLLPLFVTLIQRTVDPDQRGRVFS